MAADNICIPYPQRFIDPDEPGLAAGYCFSDSSPPELAQFGRYLNRARLGGAALDLVTRVGVPILGPSGGMFAYDHTSWWSGPTVNVGATNFAYALEMEFLSAVGASQVVYQNGGGTHVVYNNNGLLAASLNGGATASTTAYSLVDRGPFQAHALYDGANGILLVNGRQADSDAVVASNTNVGLQYMRGPADHRSARVYNYRMTAAQARALYVSQFAKRVVYHWQPSAVGEGPAGGIPTGAVGEGDWFCPLGGATLQFVWRPNLSLPGGGRLALTDSGALSLRRLAFMHPKVPLFGSWLFRFQLRDPATDNPRFGMVGQRDTDFTGAGADGYWVQVQRAAGVMQATLHEANSGANLTVNHTAAGAANQECAVLLTRHPSGDFRLWLCVGGAWAGNDATVWNDVTSLSSGHLALAPRQSYVTGVSRFQAEMTPHELEVSVP